VADNTLEIAIKAVDQTNDAFGALRQKMSALKGEIDTSISKTTQMEQAQVQSANNASTAYQNMVQVIGRISPALGSIVTAVGPLGIAIAAATAGVKLFNEAWEIAVDAAKFTDVRDAFYKMSGGIDNATDSLEKMRQASLGTVKDLTLMQGMNLADIMGIKATGDEMARLMALATERAKALGQSSEYMFDSLMRGMGRMSPMILDNLGIIIQQEQVYNEYAATIGKVADELSNAEKKAALLQAVLAQSPTDFANGVATAAQSVQAMEASSANMKIAVGQMLEDMLKLSAIKIHAFDAITERAQAQAAMPDILKPYDDYVKGMTDVVAKLQLKWALNDLANQFTWVKISEEELRQGLNDLIPTVNQLAAAEAAANAPMQENAASAVYLAGAFYEVASSIRTIPNYVPVQIDYFATGESVPSRLGAGEYPTSSFTDMNQMGLYGTGLGKAATSFANPVDISQWGKRATAAGGGGGGGASSYAAQAASQAAELRSMAQAALTPSYRGPDDLVGPYIEQWDEYARKMNAIADDSDTMWRKMVPQDILDQGEEAITKWARAEEKAFYAGQRIGEVDWGKFVEDAKKQVELAQAKEDLIAMGMRKLAEAGIGGVNAAEVLGLNAPGVSAGAAMSESFTTGLVSTDTAAAVTTAFQTQMAAQQATWTSVGVLCIGWLAMGLKAGINSQTGIDIVAALFPQFKKLLGDPVKEGLAASGL